MWSPANTPPAGDIGKWSKDVVAVTNYGNAFSLSHFNGECGGVWQRPEKFEPGEEVKWWTNNPED